MIAPRTPEPRILQQMTASSARKLEEDFERWGGEIEGMTRDQVKAHTGLTGKRAERLHAYVNRHGPKLTAKPGNTATEEVHMVIADTHARADQDLGYYEWFGRMAAELRPSHVISLGDWYDLASMFEGKGQTLKDRAAERLKDDIEAGEEAVERFERGARGYSGKKTITLGNHDDRVNRIAEQAPWLEGLFDISLAHRRAGWDVRPFLEPFRLNGVRYQHYLCREGTNKAISGKYHALRLLERVRFTESVVVGHSHRFDHRMERLPNGKVVHGLVGGCSFLHEEEYAGPDDNAGWHRGVMVLRGVQDGDFDLELWSMRRIRDRWGG